MGFWGANVSVGARSRPVWLAKAHEVWGLPLCSLRLDV